MLDLGWAVGGMEKCQNAKGPEKLLIELSKQRVSHYLVSFGLYWNLGRKPSVLAEVEKRMRHPEESTWRS
jgi:hypothetical protein